MNVFNNLWTIRKESLPKDTNDLLLTPIVRDWKPFIIRLYGTLSRSIYPGFVLLNHLMAVLSPRVFSIYRVIRISYGSSPVQEPVISNLKSQPLAEWLPDDRCLEDAWHSCWGPRSSGYDVICGSYDSTGKYGLRCCWFSRWRICITSLQFWTVVCKQAVMYDPGDSATLPSPPKKTLEIRLLYTCCTYFRDPNLKDGHCFVPYPDAAWDMENSCNFSPRKVPHVQLKWLKVWHANFLDT